MGGNGRFLFKSLYEVLEVTIKVSFPLIFYSLHNAYEEDKMVWELCKRGKFTVKLLHHMLAVRRGVLCDLFGSQLSLQELLSLAGNWRRERFLP